MKLFVDKNHQKAFNELYERYAQRLLGYFIKMFNGDIAKSQDFLQDLFVRIIERKSQFDTDRKFYRWIFTIASNMGKTSFRSSTGLAFEDWKDQYQVISNPSGETIDKVAFRKLLRTEIHKLDHHHKVVFILRHLERFSLEEIAEITESNVGTVKSRLFYATKALSKQIKQYAPEDWVDTFKIG